MSGLSREILKWIQSLDLSYSVKNPKRDFSNGFLVAEIFSRYFRLDIQMHAFDNAISLQRKLANWELLERFFIKKQVPISRDMIDACIHCRYALASSLPLCYVVLAFVAKRIPFHFFNSAEMEPSDCFSRLYTHVLPTAKYRASVPRTTKTSSRHSRDQPPCRSPHSAI
jgi:hypothetical protein